MAIEIAPEIRTYLEGLLVQAGMKNLTAELKEQMIQDLAGRLQHWFLISMTRELVPEDVSALESLEEREASKKEIQFFFNSRIENMPNLLAQAMLDFRNAYLGQKQA